MDLKKFVRRQQEEQQQQDWRKKLEEDSRKQFEQDVEKKYKEKYQEKKARPPVFNQIRETLNKFASPYSKITEYLDKKAAPSGNRGDFYRLRSREQRFQERIERDKLKLMRQSLKDKQKRFKLMLNLQKANAKRLTMAQLKRISQAQAEKMQIQQAIEPGAAPPQRRLTPQQIALINNLRRIQLSKMQPQQARPKERFLQGNDRAFHPQPSRLWKIVLINGQAYQIQPDILTGKRILKPVKRPGWL